ncbi:tetratricopeptide repeat-containing protein [Nodosilinea sp. LEGE 07088]|uniref:tetratricopeptide repeat protein n=1 Tax=Nodosilinea sp. LEGE 07088 TaxID=2777968 RepID=UPI001880F2A2|nr:tetratricopeptide repeat protein [Nodosilinea sp. LEGE 07088]MBE9138013.1 tetratricopeptide repeat-containing protein [Nodosilinea sp. LEGE 07088]
MVPFAENPGFFEEIGVLMSPALAQSASALRAEADRLFQQGIQQYNVSQFREAVQSWEQASAIYRDIQDRQGEGVALGALGNAYRSLADYRQAIDFYEQDLAIALTPDNTETMQQHPSLRAWAAFTLIGAAE